nr:4,5-dihydroxyphthalate decarboxylase [Rhodospirillales bacterium]
MTDISLTLAIEDYDHVRALTTGEIKPKGIELTCLQFQVEETFFRFANAYEWEVSELSLAKFCSLRSQNNSPVVGIPVFISRMFRHSAFYIRSDGKIKTSEDLKGCRIGVPEWTQTATVYARGWLHDEGGAKLNEVEWVQGGVNQAGRLEMGKTKVPKGIKITPISDRSLSDLLLEGELDAIISARPPNVFLSGDGRLQRLMPNHREIELDYFRRTGVYPIMHTIAIKRNIYEKNPWIAVNLMTAFEEAKEKMIERMSDINVSRIPLPWLPDTFEKTKSEFFPDCDYWPYGVEGSRETLETFLTYCYKQGVTHKEMTPEDLFVPETLTSFKV